MNNNHMGHYCCVVSLRVLWHLHQCLTKTESDPIVEYIKGKLVDEIKCRKEIQGSENSKKPKTMRSPGKEGKLEHVLDARKLNI